MQKRLVTAFALLSVVVALVWAPFLAFPFALTAAAVAGMGVYEFSEMSRRLGAPVDRSAAVALGTLVAFSGWFGSLSGSAMSLSIAVMVLAGLHMARGRQSLTGIAAGGFSLVYIGWFGAHFVLLRGLPQGSGLVTLLVTAVGITDAAAYIFGSLLGRHKMAPSISPGKSWEGAAAGFGCALIAVGVLWAMSLGWQALPQWPLWRYLAVGALLSVLGQAGDLAESCLKRSAGVKDSGALLPGHGGVLDRCDSYLFAAPVLFYLL